MIRQAARHSKTACTHQMRAAWTSSLPVVCPAHVCVLTGAAVQFWKQEWTWTQASMAQAIAARNARPGGHLIADEPMFCFDVFAICLLWSQLVYRPDVPEVRLPGS